MRRPRGKVVASRKHTSQGLPVYGWPRSLAMLRQRIRFPFALCLVVCGWFAAAPLSAQSRPGYAGDESCVSCHAAEAASYLHTAHHATSSLASKTSILGSFATGFNKVTITAPTVDSADPALYFLMESRDGRFTESAFTGFAPDLEHRTESIDLVTGSGKRGQTYLFWEGDRLFELPISFWTDGHQWVNSPGFLNGTADFARPINPGCLECHATSIQPLSADPNTNRYDRASFMPGIACETCHGPGAAHVQAHQTAFSRLKPIAEEEIINPRKLSRERQVELCAYCHNGIQREPLAPAFSYMPGKPLADFYRPLDTVQAEHPDVHGHQVALLERSKCFQASSTMTCSTCHNTHENGPTAAAYSAKCLVCHTVQACKTAVAIGQTAKNRCIECHMPVEPTSAIVAQTGDRELHATMRNHWIKIYAKSGGI